MGTGRRGNVRDEVVRVRKRAARIARFSIRLLGGTLRIVRIALVLGAVGVGWLLSHVRNGRPEPTSTFERARRATVGSTPVARWQLPRRADEGGRPFAYIRETIAENAGLVGLYVLAVLLTAGIVSLFVFVLGRTAG